MPSKRVRIREVQGDAIGFEWFWRAIWTRDIEGKGLKRIVKRSNKGNLRSYGIGMALKDDLDRGHIQKRVETHGKAFEC